MSSKFVPIPYNASSEKAMDEISNRTRIRLLEENKLDLKFDEVVNTVLVTSIKEIAAYLKRNPDTEIDISSLLKFGTHSSDSETGEKAGNIVPYVEIGEVFKLGVKNDDATEEEDDEE
jgi:hypothetical protein